MGGLFDLFIASSIPILIVLLVTGLGSYIARDRVNIMGEDARKHLNKVVFYVFGPSLVSSNLAKTITWESMVKMWFMPLNILITFIVGSVLGLVVIQLTRPPPHLRGLILGCCAAGNMGNLLIIIVPAICNEKASPFGDRDICNKYGMAYASLSMAIGAIYMWSYVYNLVRIYSTREPRDVEINDTGSPMPSTERSLPTSVTSRAEPLPPSSGLPVAEDHESGLPLPQQQLVENRAEVSISQKINMFLERTKLKKVLAPTTIGAFVGFIVGLIPQIRKLIIGDSAPLRVIQSSALLIGNGAIPAVQLIMGGNLLKGLKGSEIRKPIIVGIIGVRYVALPLIGIGVIKGAIRVGIVTDSPLYQFVLLLQFSLPPAINIGTMTQYFGAGESECSVIMLWCYVLASVSLTMWSTFFMWFVS